MEQNFEPKPQRIQPVRELVRLERLDWRLYGRVKVPGDSGFNRQPWGRHARVEAARAVVRERIEALKRRVR